VITLYDADRCPYCARTRIALAEKGVEYETVEIDLDDRPSWIYEKNPLGRVPVLEDDAFVLAESAVINEYLEERTRSLRSGRWTPPSARMGGCSCSASTSCPSRTTRFGETRRAQASASMPSSRS
jgi:glutathione S-transferase